MRRTAAFLMILFLAAVPAGCGKKTIKDGVHWPVEDFEYTDHNGKAFGKKDLEGKVWIANFVFTNCRTVCPPITANMARIQKMIDEEGLDGVEFVSFSVDPETDKPEILKEFALNFTDDLDNWHFLTGYVQKHIEQFAMNNFKMHVHKSEDDDQVIHGTDLYLVDQNGVVVKYYSALDVPYDELLRDIKTLLSG